MNTMSTLTTLANGPGVTKLEAFIKAANIVVAHRKEWQEEKIFASDFGVSEDRVSEEFLDKALSSGVLLDGGADDTMVTMFSYDLKHLQDFLCNAGVLSGRDSCLSGEAMNAESASPERVITYYVIPQLPLETEIRAMREGGALVGRSEVTDEVRGKFSFFPLRTGVPECVGGMFACAADLNAAVRMARRCGVEVSEDDRILSFRKINEAAETGDHVDGVITINRNKYGQIISTGPKTKERLAERLYQIVKKNNLLLDQLRK